MGCRRNLFEVLLLMFGILYQEVVCSFVVVNPYNKIGALSLSKCVRRRDHISLFIIPSRSRGKYKNNHHTTQQLFLSSSEEEEEPTKEEEVDNDNDNNNGGTLRRNILNSALLIAGTTVGGGFLALPSVVAPNGFIPSATTLIGVWVYFVMESMIVAECLLLCKREKESPSNPGISAAAFAAFGSIGKKMTLVLLVLLMEATLVSQISRAGSFFPSYRIGCALSALSIAGLVFAAPSKVVTETNSVLTLLFCIMAVSLFGTGTAAADWSKLEKFSSWKNIPRAIPTFLQLLVFSEILPAVCQLLNYRIGPIRWAIVIGSILPLILEVGWTALGIGLLPVMTSSGIGGLDPVKILLGIDGPVRFPLLALSVTAIATTIIGSYLALQSAADDVLATPPLESSGGRRRQRRTMLLSAAGIVLPALGIASISPDLFLKAIDFAGSYPVLLLWGLAPPAISFRLRQKLTKTTTKDHPKWLLPRWWLLFIGGVSSFLFGMSAISDLMFLVKKVII